MARTRTDVIRPFRLCEKVMFIPDSPRRDKNKKTRVSRVSFWPRTSPAAALQLLDSATYACMHHRCGDGWRSERPVSRAHLCCSLLSLCSQPMLPANDASSALGHPHSVFAATASGCRPSSSTYKVSRYGRAPGRRAFLAAPRRARRPAQARPARSTRQRPRQGRVPLP